jgi:phosphatidylglycerophosphate synthase
MPPDPAGRRPLRSRDIPLFKVVAARLAALGVSPNAISSASILFAMGAGFALVVTSCSAPGKQIVHFFMAAAFIQLRLLANMLDGMVAVEGKRGGPTGDLWNEAPDRVADVAILAGAGFATGGHPYLGFGAALMAVFIAYIRALGASVGAGQCFLGPQAKPQRMAALTVACVASAVTPDFPALPVSFVALALWIVILGGAITAWRRLAFIARFLRNRKA